jgi:hypothetical protein
MPVTLNIDILQLSALRTMTATAAEEATREYAKYPDDYHHRMLVRAQGLHDEIDAVFTAECRKVDEAVAWAKSYKESLTELPF